MFPPNLFTPKNLMTLLNILANQIRAAGTLYDAGSQEAPVAILWTDPERVWAPLLPTLKQEIPELFELGEYDPERKRGPVIWLKTILAGFLPEVCDSDAPPVFYLPGISRFQLRNAAQCPAEIVALCELLYRGVSFVQTSGRDWTLEAFFVAENGLGLEMAQDERSRLALAQCLETLAGTPLERLRGKRMKASDFDSLVVSDTPRDFLTWIGAGESSRSSWSAERWQAFRSRCRDDYGMDPEETTPLLAAEKLGLRKTREWQDLWQRYRQSPALYRGVPERLEQARPSGQLFLDDEAEPWPQENRGREDDLRKALNALAEQDAEAARISVKNLEDTHGLRRSWVWAQLGEAPLALALAALANLAEKARVIPDFRDLQSSAEWYAASGHKVDGAVMKALAETLSNADQEAVTAAIRAIYAPWLQAAALHFAKLAEGGYPAPEPLEIKEGECLLFVDGLRLDLGQRLHEDLLNSDYEVAFSTRLAALPTVTATAKAALPPIAESLMGRAVSASFYPQVVDGKTDGNELSHARFLKILKSHGLQFLRGQDLAPESPQARAWCEVGSIDKSGHDLQQDLPRQVAGEMGQILEKVAALFKAGWKEVTLATDHGWLMMPGGLEKTSLPAFLTESRWSRCAAIKGNSVPETPVVPWHWNGAEHVAVAPGATSFRGGLCYSHGGVSHQECVLPVIRVRWPHGLPDGSIQIIIEKVVWRRQRCRVTISGQTPGFSLCLRTRESDSESAVTQVKEIEADGEVSVLLEDADLAGDELFLVVLSSAGAVVASQRTRVGG